MKCCDCISSRAAPSGKSPSSSTLLPPTVSDYAAYRRLNGLGVQQQDAQHTLDLPAHENLRGAAYEQSSQIHQINQTIYTVYIKLWFFAGRWNTNHGRITMLNYPAYDRVECVGLDDRQSSPAQLMDRKRRGTVLKVSNGSYVVAI